ncbi:uncharacterized protein LAJ45_10013 [Morchella importuna]|uniref:uncharacterized protein n=1 Tax=Morchella importuna TaxID=1174673 RepID=UPI001E8DB02C|nr:uncharacterized protein LAJ45_10013 [Morchella importuna]KAH8145871.1 hypothetical protein LAJ45_10013 [Morchella importuna]
MKLRIIGTPNGNFPHARICCVKYHSSSDAIKAHVRTTHTYAAQWRGILCTDIRKIGVLRTIRPRSIFISSPRSTNTCNAQDLSTAFASQPTSKFKSKPSIPADATTVK